MKQDREERAIRELFQQLRRDDERDAPAFTGGQAPESSRREGASHPGLVWQAGAAVVLSLLIGGIWLSFSGRDAKTYGPVDAESSGRVAPKVEAPGPDPTSPSIVERTINPGRQHPKQKPAQLRRETLLLSQWRSPTESLMRMPGGQLLKTAPRLNESLIEVKFISPTQLPTRQKDQQN